MVRPRGAWLAPAAVLLRLPHHSTGPDARPSQLAHCIAVGHPSDVEPLAADRRNLHRLDLPNHVLLPGLANAHTHLDLSAAGHVPYDPKWSFADWLGVVRDHRARRAHDTDADRTSGRRLADDSGCAVVGDIVAGPASASMQQLGHIAEHSYSCVAFIEYFDLLAHRFQREVVPVLHRALPGRCRARKFLRTRIGLQPHAPYSVAPASLHASHRFAHGHNLPLSIHVAESIDERQLIAHGSGPLRHFLESLGLWSPAVAEWFGRGRTPIAHTIDALLGPSPTPTTQAQRAASPIVFAHANDASDADIELLARHRISVAYCPRAHRYFNHEQHLGPHRLIDMLQAGVNVCLGTDSVINLPPHATDPTAAGLSVLDDMRAVRAATPRDRLDDRTLLTIATTNGARALGVDPGPMLLEPGLPIAHVLAAPLPQCFQSGPASAEQAFERVLADDQPARPIDLFVRSNRKMSGLSA